MLVLAREINQRVEIQVPPSDKVQTILVTCVGIRPEKVRMGFEADKAISIDREEIAIAKRDPAQVKA